MVMVVVFFLAAVGVGSIWVTDELRAQREFRKAKEAIQMLKQAGVELPNSIEPVQKTEPPHKLNKGYKLDRPQ
jgi:hypothetical protein